MHISAAHISKPIAFSAISSLTLERLHLLDKMPADGRANSLYSAPEAPGGMCFYGIRGVRLFERRARLAPGTLVGEGEHDQICQTFRRLACDVGYVLPVSGKKTNRSDVYMGRDDGRRLIIRRDRAIDFGADLTAQHYRRLQSLIAQSRASLLGNLPVPLTKDLLEWGDRLGTYMALGAGDRQLDRLAGLTPNALFLNIDEARAATGLHEATPREVFDRLCKTTQARHVVVMTGGGEQPTFILERGEGVVWSLDPEQIRPLIRPGGHVNGLGAGDTLAGVATFLLGLAYRLTAGKLVDRSELVYRIAAFAQSVVTVHLTGNGQAHELRAGYRRLRAALQPQPPTPVAVQRRAA